MVTEEMVNRADSVISRVRGGIPDEVIRLAIEAAISVAGYNDKISTMWEALDKIANNDEYRILTAEEAQNTAWKALASIDPHYGLSSFQREQKK